MKKKSGILNSFLMLVVLFAFVLQYVHSYNHLATQLTEKNCHHKYLSSKEITHQHHNYDHCFVCDFTLSSFISSGIMSFDFKNNSTPSCYCMFKTNNLTQFFSGSLFALRAPPTFIV
jgi:hypothetical protein